MEKDLHGTQAPLSTNSPLNVEHDGKTGSPLKQFFGEEAAISHTPYNLMPLNEGCGKPERQMFGEQAPLNMTPQHGWESYPTPVSHRAKKQSE